MTTDSSTYEEVTIFLVDDDDVDVMGVQRALRKLKILNPVVRAHDGLEALELLRNPSTVKRPYIILLDLNMPRMNGFEMLTELRQDKALASSVVFVLTTSKADEDKVEAYQHNVAGYIVKNKVGEDFMGLIEMLDRYWRVVELPAQPTGSKK
ncbi:response regulator [uncultured Desulfuromonas sp.]|uniref:response regulator n=1 Tax=uncultured Desulfuromonas sp. TaxID=181013 RepID=UPI002AAB8DFE|nr:response regulator [uncultured Desulfuromonas sp.]